MQGMDWNDLRYVLAVSRAGTLAAAARRLRVDQTTVARRLAAAERVLGARLFERIDGSLRPTLAGAAARPCRLRGLRAAAQDRGAAVDLLRREPCAPAASALDRAGARRGAGGARRRQRCRGDHADGARRLRQVTAALLRRRCRCRL